MPDHSWLPPELHKLPPEDHKLGRKPPPERSKLLP